MVKLRYRSTPAACIMEPMEDGRQRVLAAAAYHRARSIRRVSTLGATVLGGGIIEEVLH